MNNQPQFQEEFEKFKNEFKKHLKILYFVAAAVIILVGANSLFYTVEPDEEAVIIRLGKYVGTYPPGPHLKLPFGVDKVIKLQTKRVLQEEFGFRTKGVMDKRTTYSGSNYDLESLMLTGDLNVADVEWVVQYQINDPFKFIFQTSEPITNIRDVSESIMRRVVGDRAVNEVLTTGRKEIAIQAKDLIQEILNRYDMGINVVTVKLQDVNPPESVKPSFNEVNEAKQEQEKVINQAERTYNQIIPEAKGKADRRISESEGQAEAIVNQARGDVNKFLAILQEYRKAPEVTRARMYIETMEDVLSNIENLYIVDSKAKGLLPVYDSLNFSSKKEN